MTQLISVEHYKADRIPNYAPSGCVTFHEYHTVRNAMVQVMRAHGSVGPLGILPLGKPDFDLVLDWESGDTDPTYYILDDQMNDTELYLYMYFCDNAGCTDAWLSDVAAELAKFDNWGIGVNGLEDGYALIFSNRLLVTGAMFKHCFDSASITYAIRSQTINHD